jgi:copper(I)-binding protein
MTNASARLAGSLLGAALVVFGAVALAETHTFGTIEIGNPWARATPSGAKVGAGYLTITNKGKDSDRLTGGSIAPASRFEVHVTLVENGVAKMRPVEGLEIKPGETVEFKPGGMHVMFLGLKQPLRRGERIKGTLVFEKAGTVAIEYAVQPAGAPAPSGHSGHRGH